MGLARTSHFALVLALLFGGCFGARCFGQSTRLATCATFAADGSLATGTLHNGELKINLDGHTILIRIEGGFQYRDSCEESFSDDGKWLAVVVPADKLTILIVDRKVQTLHRQFSSEWHQLRNVPLEPGYTFSHLDGFLHDGSVALWRYVPRAVADASDGSHVDLHLQRWSVDGELLSDQSLGDVSAGQAQRPPINLDDDSFVWIPAGCETGWCYRGMKISGPTLTPAGYLSLPTDLASQLVPIPLNKGFVGVTGKSSIQRAVLLDGSGKGTKPRGFARLSEPVWAARA